MRDEDRTSGALFSYVDVEARIGANHPLRAMRRLTNAAWPGSTDVFGALRGDRASLDCAGALAAGLAAAVLYSIRSERQLVERLEFDMLFRWFVGLRSTRRCSTPRPSREPRPPAHGRDRAGVSVFASRPAGGEGASERRTFSVDGNLLKAWASMKSFRPKSASGEGAGNGPGEPPPSGRNREADFRKTKRSNKTHASTTG